MHLIGRNVHLLAIAIRLLCTSGQSQTNTCLTPGNDPTSTALDGLFVGLWRGVLLALIHCQLLNFSCFMKHTLLLSLLLLASWTTWAQTEERLSILPRPAGLRAAVIQQAPTRSARQAAAVTIRYVKAGAGTSWANASGNLQAMINASASGDQVWVAQGTYKPGGNANTNRNVSFSMKNGVAIYGGFAGNEGSLSQRVLANALATILSGDIGTPNNAGDNSYHVISNPQDLTNSAVLDGFVITGGNANGINANQNGGGMYNELCSPTVRNCSFLNNSAYNGGAIFNNGVSGNSNPVLNNCLFQNNSATSDGGAYAPMGTFSVPVVRC